MIDLHCHILPGIDDGAPDMAASIALINAAIDDGITHIVCTPHIQLGRFDNNIHSIEQVFNRVVEEVKTRGLVINLAYAAEVRICPEIMFFKQQNTLPYIGQWQDYNVVLLELPHSHVPAGTDQLITWLFKNQVIPMIAHPERNRDILAQYSKFAQLQKLGCLFQLTASSLIGDFGEGAKNLAEKMLIENTITVIATDSHNMKRRPPNLSKGYEAAAKLIGEESAYSLVYDNPKIITACKFEAQSA
ncbi:MAG: hypothetical protein OCD00_13140 [Colwellia sp.]